jgi:hypothetical protein
MSSRTIASKTQDPIYFHREYQNDIVSKTSQISWLEHGKRAALVALPFVSLYRPIGSHLALGVGAIRTVTCFSQLADAIQQGKNREIPSQLIQSSIAAISLAGTFFAHPIGMVVTTVQDLALDAIHLKAHLDKGEYQKAFELCLNILNNSLYLAMLSRGGLELTIASLAMQILIGIYQAQAELKQGYYLEGWGHIFMAMLRGNQLVGQVKVLQMQKLMEIMLAKAQERNPDPAQILKEESEERITLSLKNADTLDANQIDKGAAKKIKEEAHKELIDVLNKYGNNKYKVSALTYAIHCGDFDAALILIENGANLNIREGYVEKKTRCNPRSFIEKFLPYMPYMYPLERAFHLVCGDSYLSNNHKFLSMNLQISPPKQQDLLPKLVKLTNYCLDRKLIQPDTSASDGQGEILVQLSTSKRIPTELCFKIIDSFVPKNFYCARYENLLNSLIFPFVASDKQEMSRRLQIAKYLKKFGWQFGWLNIDHAYIRSRSGKGNAQDLINYLEILKQEGARFDKLTTHGNSAITLLLKNILSTKSSDWDDKDLISSYLIRNGAKPF